MESLGIDRSLSWKNVEKEVLLPSPRRTQPNFVFARCSWASLVLISFFPRQIKYIHLKDDRHRFPIAP